MNQSMLNSFKQKIGTQAFNKITDMIQSEIETSGFPIILNEEYILYLFEVAILENCGIENKKIPIVIHGMGNSYVPIIPFEQLQITHKNAIQLIENHLSSLAKE